jgi:hypothetical protein
MADIDLPPLEVDLSTVKQAVSSCVLGVACWWCGMAAVATLALSR